MGSIKIHGRPAPVRARLREAGICVVQTPFQAPNANAYAERFVRSIKHECLNRVIVFGERHRRRTIAEFVEHYHGERNHQGLENELIEGHPRRGVLAAFAGGSVSAGSSIITRARRDDARWSIRRLGSPMGHYGEGTETILDGTLLVGLTPGDEPRMRNPREWRPHSSAHGRFSGRAR